MKTPSRSGLSFSGAPATRSGLPAVVPQRGTKVGPARPQFGGPARRSPPVADEGGITLKLLGFIVFLACLAVLYLARDPLLAWVGNSWVETDSPMHADAIIVLGDDNLAGQRARRAADLYREGCAPVIVASGRFLRPYVSIAELIERDLVSDGVPPMAIVRFPQHATHTVTEALALRDLCRARGWRRVLVVTSNYHTRRARYVFRALFPSSIETLVIAAPDQDFNPDAWWHSRDAVKIFFTESVAYPVAVWEVHRALTDSRP